jgi:hypothetical protein
MPSPEMIFRLIEPTDITIPVMQRLVESCADYIQQSGDSSLMPLQLLNIAEQAAFKKDVPFQFWLLIEGADIAGYAVTELVQSERSLDLNITQAYIAPAHRNDGVQGLTVGEFTKYGQDRDCDYLTASTRRGSPEAYIRWMSRSGFRKRCVVVEKSLKDGVT